MNKESLLSVIRNAPIKEVLKFKVDVMKVIVNYQNLYSKTVLMLALMLMWSASIEFLYLSHHIRKNLFLFLGILMMLQALCMQ